MFSAAPAARAAELDAAMSKIVKQFMNDTAVRAPELSTATLAVFPYNCDEKLTKKRVDVAVGELLTARILREASFRLVERAQLDTALKEQQLGLSGVIETETAVKIGKILGARFAALGTINRVGKTYQISSKLVDAESSEIISASIVDVPVAVFDEEAARYLVLVPAQEALGIYVGVNYWPIKTKPLPPVTIFGVADVVVPVQKTGTFAAMSVGVRYQVAKNWLLDVAGFPVARSSAKIIFTTPGTQDVPTGTIGGFGGRLSINRTSMLSNEWRAIYGLGYQAFRFVFNYDSDAQPIVIPQSVVKKPTGAVNVASAFARAGLEWQIKERFAWSFMVQMNQSTDITCEWTAVNYTTQETQKVKVMELDMPSFFETTFTFYF